VFGIPCTSVRTAGRENARERVACRGSPSRRAPLAAPATIERREAATVAGRIAAVAGRVAFVAGELRGGNMSHAVGRRPDAHPTWRPATIERPGVGRERKDKAFNVVELNAFSAGRLLSVGVGDLADKLDPSHVHGPVDLAGFRSRIILENFHHQGRVVRDDDARL
jgi:hypothetical protein